MRFKWAIPLQLAGCAVLAWAWLQQSEPTPASTLFPLLSLQSSSSKAAADSLNNPFATAAVQAPQHAAAAMPVVLGAQTIEVIVSHNDTLDRIFRRLKL